LTVIYTSYLVVSLVLVVGVGQQLFSQGAVFLRDVFDREPELARAVNRLLLVGFYLISLGYVLLTATTGYSDTAAGSEREPNADFRTLTMKLGALAIILGVTHLTNLALLNSARRRRVVARPGWSPAPNAPMTSATMPPR
jgi:hypothetical protein